MASVLTFSAIKSVSRYSYYVVSARDQIFNLREFPTDIKFDRLIIAFGNCRKLESPGKFLRLRAILGVAGESFFASRSFLAFLFTISLS